jgi:nucleoside 2-deoxyribosyltransferase
MNIFIICPVRNATQKQIEELKSYKKKLILEGHTPFYPAEDNPYELTDEIGIDICVTNREAMIESDEVHIFYDPTSSGSLWDLGMAFALKKTLKIVNTIEHTPDKSFSNVILGWANDNRIN